MTRKLAFLPDAAALQRLTVASPQSAAFTPVPAPGTLQVRVQVEFNSVVGTSANALNILVKNEVR